MPDDEGVGVAGDGSSDAGHPVRIALVVGGVHDQQPAHRLPTQLHGGEDRELPDSGLTGHRQPLSGAEGAFDLFAGLQPGRP